MIHKWTGIIVNQVVNINYKKIIFFLLQNENIFDNNFQIGPFFSRRV